MILDRLETGPGQELSEEKFSRKGKKQAYIFERFSRPRCTRQRGLKQNFCFAGSLFCLRGSLDFESKEEA